MALSLPNCNAYVREEVPFPLTVFDDTDVVVEVDDRTCLPGVCAMTDRSAALDWANDTFRRCRREADPVDVEDLRT